VDQKTTIEKFAKIIREQGVISATVYDALKTEKPSRRSLYRLFGKWSEVIEKAKNYLAEMGDETYKENEVDSYKLLDAEEQVRKLQRQVQELTRHIQTPMLCLDGTHHKFGYVSDSHIGSLYSDKALLNYAYDVFESEKIKTVFHSGDIIDGQKMFKGHEYELEVIGADAQVDLACQVYPQRKGITTYFIVGNHDRSFWKDGGNDIGAKISDKRKDLVCLGHQEADITIGSGDSTATVRLCHPDGGTAYAISYNVQKYVSELSPGTKPDLLLVGHYHKAEVLFYRGVCIIQGGCTQHQTPFMRGRKISASMGFWTIEVVVAPERVVSVTTRFYPVRT
jgi:predicted phosphodiesterase